MLTGAGCTIRIIKGRVRLRISVYAGYCLSLLFLFGLLLMVSDRSTRIIHASSRASGPAKQSQHEPLSRARYVGDEACKACHQKEFASYQSTAHHLTSRVANGDTIAGSFSRGANTFQTANPSLLFRMTADASGYHQTAVDQISSGKAVELSERFDIAVGSGTKAQTYLYWKEDQLFELPVSWWVASRLWINSPGYEDGSIRFNRPIYPRCLECHGSFFKSLAPPANRYERSSVVLGIECEKCHGPGAEHVAAHRAPAATPAKTNSSEFIVNPAHLPRARQLDGCAYCHAGLGEPLAPALSYTPGQTLARYLRFPEVDPEVAVDVHGNQVQLLEMSRCYRSSSMTCSTCHTVHQVQRGAASFSSFCLKCHQARQCGKFAALGEQIKQDCVNCHMPLRKSEALFSSSNGQSIQLPVRDHRIAIYREDKVEKQPSR